MELIKVYADGSVEGDYFENLAKFEEARITFFPAQTPGNEQLEKTREQRMQEAREALLQEIREGIF